MLEASVKSDLGDLEQKILKELRPDGLVNRDPGVIEKLDHHIEKDSAVIPVSINKDGSLSKTSKAADKGQFRAMSGFVRRKLGELGKEILEGRTEMDPYERGNKKACDYCPYREICCFDPKIPGNHYRRLKELKAEEIFMRMEEEDHGYDLDT